MRRVSGAHLARLLGDWPSAGPPGPAYGRLAAALRLLVLDGRLPLATRLPGERETAAALGVSRTTVTAAYAALRDSRHAASRQGSGTWTTVPDSELPTGGPGAWAPAPRSRVLDLAHASPAAPPALHAAYEQAVQALPAHLPGHGYEPVGLPELRSVVAARYTARGLPTSPDQVLVTNGAQQGVSLLLALLTDPGDRVLVDHPTYPNALDAVTRRGARLVPVALDEDGWDLDALSAAVRQTAPRAAYLVPDFHNPTGLLMPPPVRERLARVLAAGRTVAVVDETLADLPLDPAAGPPVPFAAYADPGRVVTVGSASKSFWGGLRVGWVRADRDTVRRLAALRASLDAGTPVLEQLAVAVLLADADAVLLPRRRDLAERCDLLTGLLREHLPGWRVRRPDGGLVLWCDLGAARSSALAGAAGGHGLRLAAGPRFGVDGAFERRLRLPYSLPAEVLADAVDRLRAAWASVVGDDGAEPVAAGGDAFVA
ncbi:MAG TPA: PLP-dependent aminotransferase family protein [Jiangellales bacterium]|nr:PLP-dependent aminotransferase family protein [Jiangellales bacterium]